LPRKAPCRARRGPPNVCLSCPVRARISWIDTFESAEKSTYTHAWDVPNSRKDVVSKSGDPLNALIFLKIPVNPPYLTKPKPATNDLGLLKKNYYTTKDLCKVLKLKPDTFRYRLRKGYSPEPARMGGKRRFTDKEIRKIIRFASKC